MHECLLRWFVVNDIFDMENNWICLLWNKLDNDTNVCWKLVIVDVTSNVGMDKNYSFRGECSNWTGSFLKYYSFLLPSAVQSLAGFIYSESNSIVANMVNENDLFLLLFSMQLFLLQSFSSSQGNIRRDWTLYIFNENYYSVIGFDSLALIDIISCMDVSWK